MASEGAIIPQLVESITQSSSPSPATCSVPMAGGDISSSAHSTIPCLTEIVMDEKTRKELFTDTFCRVCGAVLQFESHKNAHYEGKKHAQRVRLYFLKQELEEMTYKKRKSDRIDSQADQCFSQDKNRFCSLCNMVFSSPVVAQSHYVGKIHAKKLKLMSGEQNLWSAEADDVTSEPSKGTAPPPASEPGSTAPPLSEKSKLQEAGAEQTPSVADTEVDLSDPDKYCKLCCASFNKPLVAQQHYNGKKHARNEARRRMMEEMEETEEAMDSDALEDGNYICPICSVTLSSIEMYQSHMQGNKHQIKKNMVHNLMNNSQKTFVSFQDELEDYIKVQRARGLTPKTMLRPERDHGDSSEDPDPISAPGHPGGKPYKHYPPRPMPYPGYHSPHPADARAASWETGCWPQNPMVKRPAPHRKRPPSSPDTSDYSSSSDESSGSYKRSKRHKREHRHKDGRHHGKTRRENEGGDHKKRKPEEVNSEKEKRTEESPADRAKHRKDKRRREEPPADIKKHKKAKKPEDHKTEEELLWDESILGF